MAVTKRARESATEQWDRVTAKEARRHPSILHDWLTRVDGRFMGTPTDIHPHDAILKVIRITNGEIDYCDMQIAKLCEDELFERPLQVTLVELAEGSTLVTEKRDHEVLSRWVLLRQAATDRLARYSKMALDIGIEEAQLKLAEREADMVSHYLEAVLTDLSLTPEQYKRLGPSMRRHLELIEGTATEVTDGR
jgi:hypothetical protein